MEKIDEKNKLNKLKIISEQTTELLIEIKQIIKELLGEIKQIINQSQNYNFDSFLSEINEELKININNQPLKILFWGKPNSGKSTLINSIIENNSIKIPNNGIIPANIFSNTLNYYFLKLTNKREYSINNREFSKEEFKLYLREISENQKKLNEIEKIDIKATVKFLNAYFLNV